MVEYFVDDAGVIWPVYDRKKSPFCEGSRGIEIRTKAVPEEGYVEISFVDEGHWILAEFVLHSSLTKLAEAIEN